MKLDKKFLEDLQNHNPKKDKEDLKIIRSYNL